MVKADLVELVAQKKSIKLSEAKSAVDAVFGAMSDALSKGLGIEIRGFASFKVKQYKGRMGRNPRTGEVIRVEPKRRVIFKPGAELRNRVDSGH